MKPQITPAANRRGQDFFEGLVPLPAASHRPSAAGLSFILFEIGQTMKKIGFGVLALAVLSLPVLGQMNRYIGISAGIADYLKEFDGLGIPIDADF